MFRDLVDDLDESSPGYDLFLDVPFVPSEDAVVRTILDLAGAGRKDVLYDLGSGDGRIVIAAARHRRTRAIGVELDPVRIADAMEAAGDAGVEHLADFVEESLFEVDVSEATIVTLYLLDSINVQLRPRLLNELRPGARIVSHAFGMGDWQADETREVDGINIYKWVVPARVAGSWEWEGYDGTPYRAELEQHYQKVSGKAWRAGTALSLDSALLDGNVLELGLRKPNAAKPVYFALHFEDGQLRSVQEFD